MRVRALIPAVSVLLATMVIGAWPARAAEGPGGSETIAVTIPAVGAVSCTRDGANLPKNSTVYHGDRLNCVATGFRADERVTVALHSPASTLATATANSSGHVTYDYAVGQDVAVGAHSLSFTGQQSTTVAIYPFTVAAGQSAAASGGGGGTSGGGSSGSGGGSIATTGTNILSLLVAALALIGAGVTLNRRGLQREHS